MCGSLEKRGDGERQTERERERDRPGFKGPFGLLRSRRTKKSFKKFSAKTNEKFKLMPILQKC